MTRRRIVVLAGGLVVVGVALALGALARPGTGPARREPAADPWRAAGLRSFVEPPVEPSRGAHAGASRKPAEPYLTWMARWQAVAPLEWPPGTPPEIRDYLGRIRPVQARIEGLYAYVASLRMQVQAGGAAAVRYWTSLVAMDELGRELQKRLDAADPPAPAREIHDAFRRTIGDFALSAREILAAEFAGPTTASDDPSTPSRGQRTLQLSIIEYQYLGALLEDLLRPYRAPVPVGEPSPRTSGSPAP